MTRWRSTLSTWILIALTALMLVSARPANANPALFFVLGQLINDQRTKPVDVNTLSFNPVYNVLMNDKFVGANPDPKVIVAAVMQGTTLEWTPGVIGRRDVVGFELVCNSSEAPDKQGKYWDEFAKAHREASMAVGDNVLIKGQPRYAKWMIPFETQGLRPGIHEFTLRAWFMEEEAGGLLNLSRHDAVRREETLCKVVVLDPDYMAKAVNDLEVQQALRYSFGLMGGPTQIGQQAYSVDPQVAQQLNTPGNFIPKPSASVSSGWRQSAPETSESQANDQPDPQATSRGSFDRVSLKVIYADHYVNMVVTVPSCALSRGKVLRFERGGELILRARVTTISGDKVSARVVTDTGRRIQVNDKIIAEERQ